MNLKLARQRAADLCTELVLVSKQMSAIQMSAISVDALGAKRAPADPERQEFLTLTQRRDNLLSAQIQNNIALRAGEDANKAEQCSEPVKGA